MLGISQPPKRGRILEAHWPLLKSQDKNAVHTHTDGTTVGVHGPGCMTVGIYFPYIQMPISFRGGKSTVERNAIFYATKCMLVMARTTV